MATVGVAWDEVGRERLYATKRPLAEIAGNKLAWLPWAPLEETLTRSVMAAASAGAVPAASAAAARRDGSVRVQTDSPAPVPVRCRGFGEPRRLRHPCRPATVAQ